MSASATKTTTPVADERIAEASVWIARLHGGNRTRAMEMGLRRWLEAHPENGRAFELATEVWEDAENLRQFLPLHPPARLQTSQHRSHRRVSSWGGTFAAVAAASFLLIVGAILWYQNLGVISTGVGEQRQLVLEDGTRVFLNTDTRLVVKYDDYTRRVELRRGEALFNVAKKPEWPFIVVAGDRQVKALGTSFVVRREKEALAVTLVEGRVVVSPVVPSNRDTPAELSNQTSGTATSPQSQVPAELQPANPQDSPLNPGERLTFGAGAPARLDTPSVEKTMAWRRGQVIMDEMLLRAAVFEMNRYNTIKLIIDDAETEQLVVSGLFQVGDSVHFANAVAELYGLHVEERGNEIILSGRPNH